jgi:hypothetical protein
MDECKYVRTAQETIYRALLAMSLYAMVTSCRYIHEYVCPLRCCLYRFSVREASVLMSLPSVAEDDLACQ